MYEASYKSVPYDPEGFKKPARYAGYSGSGQPFVNPLVLMQSNVGKNAPRQSRVSPKHGFGGSISSEEDEEKATRREKQALLDEAKRIKMEERKKTYLWLSFWTGVFGLLMVGVVYYATRKSVPTAVHDVLDKSLDKVAAQWDPNLGVKACNSLDKKFLLFNRSVTGSNISSWSLRTPSVFFLQDDSDLTYDQACSIESFASLLAELVVYALQLKCAKSPSEKPTNNLKKVLAEEYKNLVPLTVEGNLYFKGTPFAGSFQCRSRRSVDQAMVITGWRFGGLAVIPDVILKSRKFINFPASQVHVSRHYVVSYRKCAPTLFYLITQLAAHRQEDFDVQAIAKEGFDTLCCAGICSDAITNDKASICDEKCPLMLITNVTEAAQHCPRTWKELGESFRVSQPPG